IKLKMTVLAPMPRASESAATMVKPGLLTSIRKPYWRSCQKVLMIQLPRISRAKGPEMYPAVVHRGLNTDVDGCSKTIAGGCTRIQQAPTRFNDGPFQSAIAAQTSGANCFAVNRGGWARVDWANAGINKPHNTNTVPSDQRVLCIAPPYLAAASISAVLSTILSTAVGVF